MHLDGKSLMSHQRELVSDKSFIDGFKKTRSEFCIGVCDANFYSDNSFNHHTAPDFSQVTQMSMFVMQKLWESPLTTQDGPQTVVLKGHLMVITAQSNVLETAL